MIPQSRPPAGYHFRDVQLELSLKPFWDASTETRDAVCRELFEQWRPLCRFAESVSIMLWIGDGSEILEYYGCLDQEFEWGRYLGSANAIFTEPAKDSKDSGHSAINGHFLDRDPEKRGVHLRSYLYRPEPACFTFHWLGDLVATLKRIGNEVLKKQIFVGETFDIGPEFAVSRFKYDWHREICGGGALFGGKFIRCDRRLHEDDRAYAGFPQGIPDGTSVGTFLGRQTRRFFEDIGFDFLWFSNGFGFALEPWALTGTIFDGEAFHADCATDIARDILSFWKDLRAELPGVVIRTRGTNLTTGIDLASDASPVREIFRDAGPVEAPVNSPWAALDGDIGLELAGWMSHIARLPGKGYRFRYYIHDPWWLNSPWLDRYQRHPFDIFLPLAVGRLGADGTVEPPSDLAFLSVDNSHGELPPVVPIEVTAHVLRAREFLPDAPGPIVWLYPFDAYHDLVTGSEKNPALPFFGDWFVRGLITHAVPVNTVADAAELPSLIDSGALRDTILLAPVLPDAHGVNARLSAYAESGGRVLLYGPLDQAQSLADLLGLSLAAPLEGDFETGYAAGSTIRHLAFLSAGGWRESGSDLAVAHARQGAATRTACALKEWPSGGQLGWVRGSLATEEYDPVAKNKILGPRLQELPEEEFFPSEVFARSILERMGLAINVEKSSADRDPILTIHRSRNAFVFSGYQPAANTRIRLQTRLGAPVFTACQLFVGASGSEYSGPTAWHHDCRIFVSQKNRSRVECRIISPIQHGYSGRLLVSGLDDATVRFLPEPGSDARLEILHEPRFPYFVGDFLEPQWNDARTCACVSGVTGEILFSW